MRESGSASVLAVAAISILLLLVPAVLDMGSVTKARAGAHNAADAAALAAAQELVGGGNPSAAASKYAVANGANVTGLTVGEKSVTVTVSKSCQTPFAGRLGLNIGPVQGQGKAELIDVENIDF